VETLLLALAYRYYPCSVFRALVPEQLEPEHLRLLGRGAKRTGFEVGFLYAVDLPCVVELVVD